jgi:hypothetical protein
VQRGTTRAARLLQALTVGCQSASTSDYCVARKVRARSGLSGSLLERVPAALTHRPLWRGLNLVESRCNVLQRFARICAGVNARRSRFRLLPQLGIESRLSGEYEPRQRHVDLWSEREDLRPH